MYSELSAVLTIAAYLMVGLAVMLARLLRCSAGWLICSMYSINQIYVTLMFHWRSNRRCPFPQRGPGLIIANHRSPVDPLVIWANHRRGTPHGRIRVISFLMAREYYEPFGVHFICKTMDAIPLSRDGNDVRPVREALRRLRDGGLVGVFPEGRMNLETDGLLPADTGLAWLALKAKVPVYPVFLRNTPQEGESMIFPFFSPRRVHVCYGDPIDLSRYESCRTTQKLLREVTDQLMTELASLGNVPYESRGPAASGLGAVPTGAMTSSAKTR